MAKVGMIGCGAWPTAIAKNLSDAGHEVWMWVHDEKYATAINEKHENIYRLPGFTLSEKLIATTGTTQLEGADAYIIGVPSAHINSLKPHRDMLRTAPLLSLVKGMTPEGLLATDAIHARIQPQKLSVLSGPNLATEIAAGKPAATVVACSDLYRAEWFQELLSTSNLRAYTSADVKGVSLGGTLKNVMAIAAGIVDGRELGENAKASLLTRALQEMIRIGMHLGGRDDTFYGLSGLGDLMATAHSNKSRNWRAGYAIGQGKSIEEAVASVGAVVEGVETTFQLISLMKNSPVDIPIIRQVHAVLVGDTSVADAELALMNRKLRKE